MKVLVTGAAGNAGDAICRGLAEAGYEVRGADTSAPRAGGPADFLRCDTRSLGDAMRAVEGTDTVVHLAAWHCAHQPPVSDETIFAVNVQGTYHVMEACRKHRIAAVVFASSMAYGWGSVYSVTKVLGEDLWRCYQEMTGASVAMLRYHAFVPGTYLEYGARMLSNGVDRRDVVTATVASVRAAVEKRFTLLRTIVHSDHGMPADVVADFAKRGPAWCESLVPGAAALLAKYRIALPARVEQHDLSEAARVLGWKPAVGFVDFLKDLRERDARGEDVSEITVPGELPAPGQRTVSARA